MDGNPQEEFNMGNGSALAEAAAMDAATDAEVRAASVPGAPELTPEAIAAAKEKAKTLIESMRTGEGAAGLKDLAGLTLSMGLPATRAIFRSMVAASPLKKAEKEECYAAIEAFSPITEVGCMKVDFYNGEKAKADVAYLLMDDCPRTHDLGAEIDKLKPLVAEEKWPEILKHFSMLVFMARSVYAQTAANNLPLLRRIHRLKDDDPCQKWLALQVDMTNTTLYVDPGLSRRVGLYIRFDGDPK